MEHCKNQFDFDTEVRALAKMILEEYDCSDGVDSDWSDYCHEVVDGHQWVIYYYQATQLCCNVDTDEGEQWLADIWETPYHGCSTIQDCHTRLAYACLYVAVQEEVYNLLEELEE